MDNDETIINEGGLPIGTLDDEQLTALNDAIDRTSATLIGIAKNEWQPKYGKEKSFNMAFETLARVVAGTLVGTLAPMGKGRVQFSALLLGQRIGQHLADMLAELPDDPKPNFTAFVSNEVGHA